ADAVRALGLPSTTCAGGAKAVRQSDWAPLAGRDVVILPDADPPGEKYADDVARLLRKLTPPSSVRVVALPGLAEGEDVFDFAARARADGRTDQQTREVIEALAAATPPWEPPGRGPGADSTGQPTPGCDRPLITISTEEHEVNAQAAAALAN